MTLFDPDLFLSVALPAMVIHTIIGLGIKLWLDNSRSSKEITRNELLLVLLVTNLLIVPIATNIGARMAFSNLVTFNEIWGGNVTDATEDPITCHKNGSCRHTYQCEPHDVTYYETVCTGSGDDRECHQEQRTRTEYHSCPYFQQELNYTVVTTLGNYTLASHRLPQNYSDIRWTGTYDYEYSVPSWIISNAGVGPPQQWTDERALLDQGIYRGMAQERQYENYILAAEGNLLESYSSDIEQFQNLGILPPFPGARTNIHHTYLMNRVVCVGVEQFCAAEWQQELGNLNARLGRELQGSLYVVFVDSNRIPVQPDVYMFALKAFWQDSKTFGRDVLAKNGIMIVIAVDTDTNTIDWARAETGMPEGNTSLIQHVRSNFTGVALTTPQEVIGDVDIEPYFDTERNETRFRTLHGSGLIENLLWGVEVETTRFVRISMSADDEEDEGLGFKFLINQIRPTAEQRRMIVLGAAFVSILFWIAAALIGDRAHSFGYRW